VDCPHSNCRLTAVPLKVGDSGDYGRVQIQKGTAYFCQSHGVVRAEPGAQYSVNGKHYVVDSSGTSRLAIALPAVGGWPRSTYGRRTRNIGGTNEDD
jgi:hypothetical protein